MAEEKERTHATEGGVDGTHGRIPVGVEVLGSRGGNFVIDIRNGETFELNETAMLVLQRAGEGRSLEETVQELHAQSPRTPRREITDDVRELVEEFHRLGILDAHGSDGNTSPANG